MQIKKDVPSSTVSAHMLAPDAADRFLKFLEQRQIAAFLFTREGNTMISLCNVQPMEAQRLLAQWQAANPRETGEIRERE